MVLVVDLEGVGQDMLAVPIKADCQVPKVRVQPSDFHDYEVCFLRHPKTKRIEIINEDSLKAKFEMYFNMKKRPVMNKSYFISSFQVS